MRTSSRDRAARGRHALASVTSATRSAMSVPALPEHSNPRSGVAHYGTIPYPARMRIGGLVRIAMKRLSIADLVQETDVPAATIHYYLRNGLLPQPKHVSPN